MAPATPAPSVSVVLAAHNASATLESAVRSALAEDVVVECLIVDDASTDGTDRVARSLEGRDARVRVVHRARRGGPAAARNDGLRHARGAQVCWLDADDALVAGGLGALAGAMAATGGAVAAMGRFRAVDDDGRAVDVGRWSRDQLHGVLRRHGRTIESPHGLVPEALVTRLVSPPPGAWLVDARCARAIGGFDVTARRSEDVEFLVRLARTGRVLGVDLDVLAYRRHPAQRSAATTRRRWGRGHTMWVMLRAAPGANATRDLARGMAAYHLELWASRRGAASLRTRAMSVRNLATVPIVRLGGIAASAMPRHVLAPIDDLARTVD